MFENSLRLVVECGLTWLHVFPYSARPGTPAARMPQVDGAEIKARARRLRDAGDTRLNAFLTSRKGLTESVLMETETRGRTAQFSEITLAEPARAGDIVTARVTGQDEGKLTGVLV
jgi:threonylcarbamoyladenosine tRNA methylthiotransferase MtaB